MHLTVGVRIAVTLLINRFCYFDLLTDDPLFYTYRFLSGVRTRPLCTILKYIVLSRIIKSYRLYIRIFLAY